MPKIIPIRELKNTATISKYVQESNEPVFVTKNGYGSTLTANPLPTNPKIKLTTIRNLFLIINSIYKVKQLKIVDHKVPKIYPKISHSATIIRRKFAFSYSSDNAN